MIYLGWKYVEISKKVFVSEITCSGRDLLKSDAVSKNLETQTVTSLDACMRKYQLKLYVY